MELRFILPANVQRGDDIQPVSVDWESKVTFVARNRDAFVFHTSSGTHWSRIGERSAHPAEFHVCEVLGTTEYDDGTMKVHVKELIEFSPRKAS